MSGENHTQSPSITLLAAALAKLQSKIGAAQLDATNPFLHNRYASLGSIMEVARPVLAENDLAICQMPINGEATIGLETMLMHKSGEFVSRRIVLPLGEEKGKSSAQVAGSIITYLRRYSLASFLGIYAEEDTDGQRPTKGISKARPSTPVSTPPRSGGDGTVVPGAIKPAELKMLENRMRQNGWLLEDGTAVPEAVEYLGALGYEHASQIPEKEFPNVMLYFGKKRPVKS